MKKLLFLFVMLSCITCSAFSQGFTISGTKLLDANGNNFIMRGTSIPLAWFVSDVNNNIENIQKNSNSNCLRIVIDASTSENNWHTCVQKCIENGIIPMVELHDVTCGTTSGGIQNMAAWWAGRAAYLTQPKIAKYILINIANEWGDWNVANANPSFWRDEYTTAITTIRNAGIKTTLVIDAPNCGQDIKAKTIKTYAMAVLNSDPQKNILFSIHMYGEWGVTGGSKIATDLPAIKAAGIPIIVGEFGFKHTSGKTVDEIDETLILKTCQSDSIGWLSWSLKGNNDIVQYLDLSSDWAMTNLNSWGNFVVNSPFGLKNTANTASVFLGKSNCTPITINPYLQINKNDSVKSFDAIASIGDSISFIPQIAEEGAWKWIGPVNYSDTNKIVTLRNLQPTDAGYYRATFTNIDSCIGSITFHLTVKAVPAGESSIVSGKAYKIVSKTSGLSINVKGFSDANNIGVEQRNYLDSTSQQWFTLDIGNENWEILRVDSAKALCIYNGSIEDVFPAVQRIYTGATDQSWKLIADSNGYFNIKNAKSGKCLEVSGASTTNGASIIQWTCNNSDHQKFSFINLPGIVLNIAETPLSNEITIFPNPSNQGNFRILLGDLIANSDLLIYNLQGNLVYHAVLSKNETEIASGLSKGIYLVKITYNQNSYCKKLIVD